MASRVASSLVPVLILALLPAIAAQAPAPADTGALRAELLAALDTGDYTLQELLLPADPAAHSARFGLLLVDVELDGEARTLELYPHSLRADDYRLVVQDASGEHPGVSEAPATWRGQVLDAPGSVVAASIRDGGLTAWLRLGPDAAPHAIQPARRLAPDAGFGPATHAVHSSRDTLWRDVSCGTPDRAAPLPDDDVHTSGGGQGVGPGDATQVWTCEIACDADVQFYQDNGSSVAATEADIESILNGVEAIYQSNVAVVYEITHIIVRTAEPDPYSESDSSALLLQFLNHWNNQQQAVPRDVAHLFTGRNLSGSVIGVAYLNTICGLESAYGLSESNYSGSFTNRVALTAHELGHNWSAPHCNGAGDCQIMCSSVGGCGSVTAFGNGSKGYINNKKTSSFCIDQPPPTSPPVLFGSSAPSVSVFHPPLLSLYGQGFEAHEQVLVGDVVVDPTDINVASNTLMYVTPPTPTALGANDLVVTNVLGPSNALNLTYTAVSSPQISGPALAVTGQPFSLEWAGPPGQTAFLLLSFNPATFQVQGLTLMQDFIILVALPLDHLGLGGLGTPAMPVEAAGNTFRMQIVTIGPGGIATGSSNVHSFLVPF